MKSTLALVLLVAVASSMAAPPPSNPASLQTIFEPFTLGLQGAAKKIGDVLNDFNHGNNQKLKNDFIDAVNLVAGGIAGTEDLLVPGLGAKKLGIYTPASDFARKVVDPPTKAVDQITQPIATNTYFQN